MVQRISQPPVIIVFEGDKAERLQHAIRHIACRAEYFGHAVHRPRLGLKCDFDKIALRERLRQTEQAPGYGNTLQFGFGAASVFQTNCSQNGVSKLDPGGTPRGVRLGEVGHRSKPI